MKIQSLQGSIYKGKMYGYFLYFLYYIDIVT